MKTCTKCKVKKPLDQFCKNYKSKDNLGYHCKECANKNSHKNYIENRERNLANIKSYLIEYDKTEKGQKVRKKALKKFTKSGKAAKYVRERRKIDIQFNISSNLRSRAHSALKGKGKSNHTFTLLGCSLEYFKQHIESKFQEGMTFENYGKVWDLDHIIPCSYFDLSIEENQYICFNFRNLQPLECRNNRVIKKNKVPENVLEFIQEIKNHL